MFMSTTDHRNHIGNEWTLDKESYQKLMCGQINDTKHTKTFIARPFGNSLDLGSVGDLYFFTHGAHESVGKHFFFSFFFFCSEAKKKNTFSHQF